MIKNSNINFNNFDDIEYNEFDDNLYHYGVIEHDNVSLYPCHIEKDENDIGPYYKVVRDNDSSVLDILYDDEYNDLVKDGVYIDQEKFERSGGINVIYNDDIEYEKLKNKLIDFLFSYRRRLFISEWVYNRYMSIFNVKDNIYSTDRNNWININLL
jgi:hypothetical protein